MNITEKEKVKRVEILTALEKKIARRLQQGQIQEAIDELKDIIDDYKLLGLVHKAQILELTLNQLLLEINQPEMEIEEPPIVDSKDPQAIIQILENRSKKAIRRFIQGKIDEAVSEMLDIIEEFRKLNLEDRAKALEDWMLQFLGKHIAYETEQKPLAERLEVDPELEEQLLSYRTQHVLKRFIQGQHRRAVEEFTEIVNEYKRKGKLDIVETLEIWFNLFITKMYLVPTQKKTIKPTHPPRPSISTSHTAEPKPIVSPPPTPSPPSLSLIHI